MRILVTGGAGFIGSHLCEALLDKSDSLVCLDNFNDYYNPSIKRKNVASLLDRNQFELVEGDILDSELIEDLFQKQSFDVVVHLAARAGVRPSIQQPKLYQKVNIEGTLNLLEQSAKIPNLKFILASTSSIYGSNKKVPFSESDNVDHPVSPYAATKKACELMAYTYHHLYQFPVTCLRFFTVYGPRQRPDMAIHKFTRLISEGKEIAMFGDGTSRRDYTYYSDIVSGILNAIEHCNGYEIYNLGESQTIELKALIQLIEKALGKKAKIKQYPNQPGDVPITYADVSKAREKIGYKPGVSIEKGIPKFVEWFQNTFDT